MVGLVVAGVPMLASHSVEEHLTLPAGFVSGDPSGLFFLTANGDSMMTAGILNGDFVLVRQQAEAGNGEIVVAMIDGGGDSQAVL